MTLKWQGGVEFFTQNYDQHAVNTLERVRAVAADSVPGGTDLAAVGNRQHRLRAVRPGHADASTTRPTSRWVCASITRRAMRCSNTFFTPAICPGNTVTAEASFYRRVAAVRVRLSRDGRTHGLCVGGRGYKAGGFNPAALPGSEAYDEEHAWHFEGGVKSTLAGGKVGQRRQRLLHRLGRPAVERAEPVRARTVLHLERRSARAAAASSST